MINIETLILSGSKILDKPSLHKSLSRRLIILFGLVLWLSSLTAGLRAKTESLIYNHYGDSISVLFKKIPIPEEIKFTAEKNAQLRFMRDQIYIWEISRNEEMIGLAYLDNVKGKSQPITYAVFFDSQGMVEESHIIKYREPIGGEVSNQYWLNQFFGKSWESDYKIGSDIDGISGATISVNAVTRGIHRSTIIVEYLLIQKHE